MNSYQRYNEKKIHLNTVKKYPLTNQIDFLAIFHMNRFKEMKKKMLK